jgi:hypothetical protein
MSSLNTNSEQERHLLQLAKTHPNPTIRKLAQEQLIARFDYTGADFAADSREVAAERGRHQGV